MQITTNRLLLNRFKESDSKLVCQLAGDEKVAQWTATIPYPYPEHKALEWIQGQASQKNKIDFFAVRLIQNENLIGCVDIERNQDQGILGYWIGRAYWGKGLGTEAVRAIIQFGFETRKLNQIKAFIKRDNISSQRLAEKAGMKNNGIIKNHHSRNGVKYDVSVWSISKSDWTDFFESSGSVMPP